LPASRPRSSRLKSILNVQPDWRWEELAVKLTDNGTLLARYGRHRGRHRFEKRGSGVSHVIKAHERLGIDGAMHAVDDLIGSDRAGRGQVRPFLREQINGAFASRGMDAHIGRRIEPCPALGIRSYPKTSFMSRSEQAR
jgi:hypothetical protein